MLALLRQVDKRGVRGILLHRGNAILRAGLRVVCFADRVDLAVPGLEPEPELALRVLVQLEVARHAALPLRDHHTWCLIAADLYHGHGGHAGCSAGAPRRNRVSALNRSRGCEPAAGV